MPLRDVTHVVFDRGTGSFNEAAALEAYHLIAKMDDADAAEFVFHVVNEVVENTITGNVETIQKHLNSVIAKSLVYADLDAVAEGLSAKERAEVKKQLLQAVSKSDSPFDPKEHPRGEGGRFKIDPNHKIDRGEANRMRAEGEGDIPDHPDFGEMSPEQKKAFRGQYAQIASAIGRQLNGEKNVVLHYADGTEKTVNAASARKLAEHINPHESKNVVAVSVSDYKPTIGGRVADLTGSLGSGVARMSGNKAEVGNGESGFTRQWYSASPDSNQQMYNRIGAGSQVLDSVSAGSPKLKAAAAFGSFVGQHGSQAEQVFGPPARRMAYRYRGTERKPDRSLVTAYGNAIHSAKTQSGRHTPEQNIERAPSWEERQNGRDQVIGWLRQPGRAPSKALSNLQLAAGHTPPSEGVLINADGQIVTTAVGSADDWYLPFNLRHLQSLKGGEYIRSRSTGGLTTEDIYTGLMTGARRVTVVSRSGTYSIEFDPELRGGRRNNDKALRMSQRYGELLDAVQSGKVERQGLAPEDMREIQNEVLGMYGPDLTGPERRAAENALIQRRKENPASIDADINALDEHYEAIQSNENRELVPDEKADYQRQRLSLMSQKEYFYKLNGLGYKAAQEALKEQFPYYIASATSRHELGDAILGSNDRGYVEPGALRPTAARANLFGGAQGPEGTHGTSGGPAMSARRADRAVPIVDRYGRDGGTPAAPGQEPDEPKDGGGSSGALPRGVQDAGDAAADAARNAAMRETAADVHANLGWVNKLAENGKPIPGTEALHKYAAMKDDEFKIAMRERGAPEKFHAVITDALSAIGDAPFRYGGREKFEEAIGPAQGGEYDFKKAAVVPEKIFTFTGLTKEQKNIAATRPLALSNGVAGDEGADLLAEVKMRALLDQVLNVDYPEKATQAEAVPRVLGEKGLYPSDARGQQMIAGYMRDQNLLKESMKNIQIQRYVNSRPHAPAVSPASQETKALPAGPATRHDGTPLTEGETRQGWYWDEGDNQRRYI